jgi:hypothetical protein
MKLYELANEYQQILNAIGTTIDTEQDPLDLALALNALSGDLHHKLENCGLLIKSLDAEAAAIAGYAAPLKTEYDRQMKRSKARENEAARLKNYVLEQMVAIGWDRVNTPRVVLRPQRSGTPRIEWTGDPRQIPDAYRVDTSSLDK